MSKWNANPIAITILSGLLVVMLLIAVLPQVDLLDTAFHRGNSPVATRTRFTAPPVLAIVTPVTSGDAGLSSNPNDRKVRSVPDSADVVSSLLCNFRC
jgi:hypothetical protein